MMFNIAPNSKDVADPAFTPSLAEAISRSTWSYWACLVVGFGVRLLGKLLNYIVIEAAAWCFYVCVFFSYFFGKALNHQPCKSFPTILLRSWRLPKLARDLPGSGFMQCLKKQSCPNEGVSSTNHAESFFKSWGFFQVLMGVFDLASAVRFLSQPTLSGFVTGGAVLIIISQLKSFFGFAHFPHAGGPFQKIFVCIVQINEANWINVGLCSCLILIIISCKRLKAIAKRKPKDSNVWRFIRNLVQIKEILVVVCGILFVRLTKHHDASALVPTVGYIPQGLPPLRLPWELDATRKLLDGPADVLHNFVLSGAIVAFSTFLTSTGSVAAKNQE